MRGTHLGAPALASRTGIIPAYAGNTRIVSFLSPKTWDHPRICGEHFSREPVAMVPWGSSPHMRGTHTTMLLLGRESGIIPAYAGNTVLMISVVDEREDHPRICGEHCLVLFPDLYLKGSSPHMRGTRPCDNGYIIIVGIIPAYAGNTRNWRTLRL